MISFLVSPGVNCSWSIRESTKSIEGNKVGTALSLWWVWSVGVSNRNFSLLSFGEEAEEEEEELNEVIQVRVGVVTGSCDYHVIDEEYKD